MKISLNTWLLVTPAAGFLFSFSHIVLGSFDFDVQEGIAVAVFMIPPLVVSGIAARPRGYNVIAAVVIGGVVSAVSLIASMFVIAYLFRHIPLASGFFAQHLPTHPSYRERTLELHSVSMVLVGVWKIASSWLPGPLFFFLAPSRLGQGADGEPRRHPGRRTEYPAPGER